MQSNQIIRCPHCQSDMQVPANMVGMQVLCPTCQGAVTVGGGVQQPQPGYQAPVQNQMPSMNQSGYSGKPSGHAATPANQQKSSVGLVLAGVFVCGTIFLILIGIGVAIYFFSSQMDGPAVSKTQDPVIIDDRALDPARPYGDNSNVNLGDPESDSDFDPQGLRVDYKSGDTHTYFYNLKLTMNREQIVYHGTNTLTARSDFRDNREYGVPTQQLGFSTSLWTDRREGERTVSYPSRPDQFRGTLTVDRTGDYYSSDNEDMVPLLMKPIGLIGVERFDPTQGSWTASDEIMVTDVEEPKSNDDPLARYRSRFSRTKTQPKVSVSVIDRRETYEVLEVKGDEVKVSKTLVIAPRGSARGSSDSTRVSATGHFIYNKKLKLVTETRMKGRATVTEGPITMNFDLEYRVSYRSKEQMAQMNKEAAERRAKAEKRANEALALRKKAKQPTKTGESLTDFSDQYLGQIQDVRWGAKGVGIVEVGDRKFVMIARFDNKLQAFDWNTRLKTDEKDVRFAGNATTMAVSPDRKKVIYGGYTGQLPVYEVDAKGKLTETAKFVGHSKQIQFIKIADDNRMVVSGDSDGRVRVWDLETGKESAVFALERSPTAVHIAEDRKTLQVSDSSNIYVINLAENKIESTTRVVSIGGRSAAFSPDGKLFAHAESSRQVRVIDARTLDEIKRIEIKEISPKGIQFSPDSNKIYFGVHGFTYIHDMDNNQTVKFKILSSYGLEAVDFTSDGENCAIGTRSNVLLMRCPEIKKKEVPDDLFNQGNR